MVVAVRVVIDVTIEVVKVIVVNFVVVVNVVYVLVVVEVEVVMVCVAVEVFMVSSTNPVVAVCVGELLGVDVNKDIDVLGNKVVAYVIDVVVNAELVIEIVAVAKVKVVSDNDEDIKFVEVVVGRVEEMVEAVVDMVVVTNAGVQVELEVEISVDSKVNVKFKVSVESAFGRDVVVVTFALCVVMLTIAKVAEIENYLKYSSKESNLFIPSKHIVFQVFFKLLLTFFRSC